jgi:hypothetical protein
MLRNTILTCAAAAVLCLAVSAASTGASAGPTGAANTHPANGGNGALAAAAGGGSTKCQEAECGGDPLQIDDNYVVRGCGMTPADAPLPPWCESSAGGSRQQAVIAK